MAETSEIEWTDATWNPITGCTLVDDGCRNCYAAELASTRLKNHPSRIGLARRNAEGVAKFTGEVRLNEQWLDQPLHWKRARMIFVCAHGDLFHPAVPDEWIDRVFAVMALCPQHTFQVLTKRPERAREYLARSEITIMDLVCDRVCEEDLPVILSMPPEIVPPAKLIAARNEPVINLRSWPLPNVWLGTSVSDQGSADARIPDLLATPASVRFISAEPLLGPVDLTRWSGIEGDGGTMGFGIDWVIVGGESGRQARPMHPDWARSLRDQCVAAGVAFFFKQWGEWAPLNGHGDPSQGGSGAGREVDIGMIGARQVGKKAAGRLLDGRTWDQMPKQARND